MKVDLSRSEQGRIKFRNGEEWWCPYVVHEDDGYFLRYEHAWYVEYKIDGTRVDGKKDRDVIEFEPCEWDGKLMQGCNP